MFRFLWTTQLADCPDARGSRWSIRTRGVRTVELRAWSREFMLCQRTVEARLVDQGHPYTLARPPIPPLRCCAHWTGDMSVRSHYSSLRLVFPELTHQPESFRRSQAMTGFVRVALTLSLLSDFGHQMDEYDRGVPQIRAVSVSTHCVSHKYSARTPGRKEHYSQAIWPGTHSSIVLRPTRSPQNGPSRGKSSLAHGCHPFRLGYRCQGACLSPVK